MATENAVLLQKASDSLKGKWKIAVLTNLIYLLIILLIQIIPKIGGVLSLVVGGPLAVGMTIFSLNIARNQEAKTEQIFEGFNNFSKSLATYLLVLLFTLLWTLLLIIPGIIAALSYSMVYYIIVDNPSISAMDAINKSKKMMDGHKLKMFWLGLRFLGLGLLCILTLGIGFLWLGPYVNVTLAHFYEDIKHGHTGQ